MGTRSTIIQKLDNGKYRSIYCHWDGYLSHNGKILLENYKDSNKVSKLLELGALSSLNEECEIPEGVLHNYKSPQKNITVAYFRDRGEEDWEDVSYLDKDSLRESFDEFYSYLFFEGNWYMPKEVFNYNEDEEINLKSMIKNIVEIEGHEMVLLEDLKDYLNNRH